MTQVKDVVCGMTVDTETAHHTTMYEGQPYYFCSAGCKHAFDKEPEKYVSPAASGHAGHGHHEAVTQSTRIP